MADKLAWLFVILIGGSVLVGVIGLLLPVILFVVGFGLAMLTFSVLAWLIGRILS